MSAALQAYEPSTKYIVQIEPLLIRGFDLLVTAPDGIRRLRSLICTLAVRGLLVLQDADDEPAFDLLTRIRAERNHLIATGTVKKEKPLATLRNDDRLFPLPDGWTWMRFGAVIDASEAGWSPSCDGGARSGNSWGVLKVSAVSWGEFRSYENKALPKHLEARPELEVRDGDFLISRANTAELVAKSVVVSKPEPRLMLSDKIIRLRLSSFVDGKFFNLVNNSEMARDYYAANASGTSSSMKNVGREVILSMPVPVPPLAEQHRIVARVEELMKLCDALEQSGRLADEQHARLTSTLFDALAASESAHALAENWQRIAEHFDLLLDRPEAIDALEQTILQLAVRGLLVPQDARDEPADKLLRRIQSHKDRLVGEGKLKRDKPLPAMTDVPFELPTAWQWARLGSLGESFDYGTSQKSVDDPRAVPVLRMGNIQAGKVVMSNLKYLVDQQNELPSLLLRAEDLLFNRTNSYELVGKTGLYEGFDRDVTFASYLIRIRFDTSFCSAQYINLYMNTIDCRRNEIEADLTQQTGQANYNGTKLRNIRVPLPPLAEQHRIVARVEELRRLCTQLRERLTEARRTQSQLADALVAQASA